MAEINQFGSVRPSQSADAKHCAQFEAMLADAVDGTLTAEEQAAFDRHLVGCEICSGMLADAKRGAAWMEMLRQQRPEPPVAMLERIFSQTSGARVSGVQASGAETSGARSIGPGGIGMDADLAIAMGAAGVLDPVAGSTAIGNLLPFRKRVDRRFDLRAVGHTLLQPRLAMTAAMAFFSIALTLNLTGVRLSDLRASDLKPSSLKRSIYSANAHVVRYYTNLRVVYELESRVRDLQRSTEDDVPAAPAGGTKAKDGAAGPSSADPGRPKNGQKEPETPPKRRASPGTSRREPLRDDPRVVAGIAVDGDLDPSIMNAFGMLSPRVDLPMQGRGTV